MQTKHHNTLYSTALPIWLLLILPTSWLYILPLNFLVNSVALVLANGFLDRKEYGRATWKTCILAVCLNGFIADFAATAVLYLLTTQPWGEAWQGIVRALMSNPFPNAAAFFILLAAITLAGLIKYGLNRIFAFKKLDVDVQFRRKLALAVAISTAPFTFLLSLPLL